MLRFCSDHIFITLGPQGQPGLWGRGTVQPSGGPGRTSTKKLLVIMLSWGSPMFLLRLYSLETKKKGSSCI